MSANPDLIAKAAAVDFARRIVPFWQTALGAELTIPTLDGEVAMKLPAGSRSGQKLRLAQRKATERLEVYSSQCRGLLQPPLEQRYGVIDTPVQRVRCTQGRSRPGEIVRQIHVPTNGDRPFEHGKRPGQVAPAQGQQTDPLRGIHHAHGGSHCLGNAQPFFP